MAWNLEGTFYENCSCDAICPCTWSNLAHRATRDDYCRFAMAFQVASGDIEGVDVSGRSFVMIGDTPPDMAQGNWRLGVFVDDGATGEQVAKLGEVLSGQLGGPPEALGPLLGEFLGIEQAPISVEPDGNGHRVRVGDSVDYTGTPVTIEGGEAGDAHQHRRPPRGADVGPCARLDVPRLRLWHRVLRQRPQRILKSVPLAGLSDRR